MGHTNGSRLSDHYSKSILRRGLQSSFVPSGGSLSLNEKQNKFSSQNETLSAIGTRKQSIPEKKLRYVHVDFVPARAQGNTKPVDLSNVSHGVRAETVVESTSTESKNSLSSASEKYSLLQNQSSLETKIASDLLIDTQDNDSITTGLLSPCARPDSPTPSNSSDDIILFRGRNASNTVANFEREKTKLTFESKPSASTNSTDEEKQIQQFCLRARQHHIQIIVPDNTEIKSDRALRKDVERIQLNAFSETSDPRNSLNQKEDELLADYIANVDAQDTKTILSFVGRDLGGNLLVDHRSIKSTKSSEERSSDNDSSENNSQDELSHRSTRDSSNRDQTRNGKRATSSAMTTCPETLEQRIADPYDSITYKNVEPENMSKVNSSQHQIFSDTDDSFDSIFVDYAKLELCSNDSLSIKTMKTVDFLDTALTPPLRSQKKRNGKKKQLCKKKVLPGKKADSFTDQFYDAYDVFDFMRFDPPAPQKGKSRKANIASKALNQNIEESINAALQKDRTKKKERKKERKKLRESGLLGHKSDRPNMKVKYKNGMSIYDLKEELKDFLEGENAQIILPPMGKTDRVIVHEIANMFKLKTASDGEGTKRFVTLYRTSKTYPFTEEIFDFMETNITQRFLSGSSLHAKKPPKINLRNGGFIKGDVSYRDGEVVGGSAPEIAADNKGRAMLERMGWRSGTALGAPNNKGRLQPVSHIVKTTKAGLG